MPDPQLRQISTGPADLDSLKLGGVWCVSNRAESTIRHNHLGVDTQLFIFTTAGEVTLEIDDGSGPRELDVPLGHCVLASDKTVLQISSKVDWHSHWYNFNYGSVHTLPRFQTLKGVPIVEMTRLINLVSESMPSASLWQRRYAASSFATMLMSVLAKNQADIAEDDVSVAIGRVTRHLCDNLDQIVTAHEMAEIAGMSMTTFRSRFKQVMGMTYKVYYDSLRMDQAYILLVQGLSVSEVASRLAYSDQFHFSRAFRRVYGRTPSSLKKAHRE